MNYENMSDLEVNQAVAETMNLSWYLPPKSKYNDSGRWIYSYHENVGVELPDYCNNPSDAWPVIVESKISLVEDGCEWNAYLGFESLENMEGGGCYFTKSWSDKNPLRAAMIVYLMMQENEQ